MSTLVTLRSLAGTTNNRVLFHNANCKFRLIEQALDIHAPFEKTEYTQLLKATGSHDILAGWGEDIDGILNLISGGPAFHSIQAQTVEYANISKTKKKKVIMIFFIGGCTYSEIAACRLIAKMRDVHILISTTKIINGKTLLSSFDPKLLRQ